MWPKLEFVGCYVGYFVNTYTNMHSLCSLKSNIIMFDCFYMQKYIKFEEATKLGYIHLTEIMECKNAELKLVM